MKEHVVYNQKSYESAGSRKPNAFGLYDMEGNVSEWAADLLAERFSGEAETDPKGPGEGEWRMYRGGAYDSPAWACRSAVRWTDPPSERYSNTGFRVVLDHQPASPKGP
jgi:formylglycine-generating enzyme required for sulfatase activity